MKTRKLHKALHRKRRRAPANLVYNVHKVEAAPLSPRVVQQAAELVHSMLSDGPIHGDRTFGSGSDRLWCHICMGQQIEFVAPACEGLPLRSAVLTRQEFETLVAWVRAEFDSISKPKTARQAQQAAFVN